MTKNTTLPCKTSALQIKRVYDPPESSDGFRVLVDRLWPRGLSRKPSRIDLWLKESAPSPALRTWFSHDTKKWEEFRARYKEELRNNPGPVILLKKLQAEKPVTLLFASSDISHNNAVVLREFLLRAKKGTRTFLKSPDGGK
jgi:uncharacterized protein YeaO (DUF488 family)